MENYFSKNLMFLRKRTGETQIEVAAALDLTRSTYANYEAGENVPKIDVMSKILEHFEVTFEDLVFSDLSNVQVNENSDKKTRTKNVQGNVQGSVQVNTDFTENEDDQSIVSEPHVNYDMFRAKYIALLEDHKALYNRYLELLEAKITENDFRYKFEDVQATLKALQELILRGDLSEMSSYSEKHAALGKKKHEALVELGIVAGDSR